MRHEPTACGSRTRVWTKLRRTLRTAQSLWVLWQVCGYLAPKKVRTTAEQNRNACRTYVYRPERHSPWETKIRKAHHLSLSRIIMLTIYFFSYWIDILIILKACSSYPGFQIATGTSASTLLSSYSTLLSSYSPRTLHYSPRTLLVLYIEYEESTRTRRV